MRNRLIKTFVAIATCCLVLASASPSLAQWQERYPSRDYGYERRDYVERLVRQAENRSDQFARMLEQSRYRGGLLERIFSIDDRTSALTARAHDLESQLNVVADLSQDGNSYELRSRIANVLSVAQDIDNTMRYSRVSYGVERQWSMLRSDLNRLARVFDLRPVS